MQAAKSALASAKEAVENVASSARSGMEKTKASAQGQMEKAMANTPAEKAAAEHRKEERKDQAEIHKREAQEQQAAVREQATAGGVAGPSSAMQSEGQRHPTYALATEHGSGYPTGGDMTSSVIPPEEVLEDPAVHGGRRPL